jgi:O-antigen ligase
MPLSLSPVETADALGILVAAVMLFWIARDGLRSSGQRTVARAIAWMGLLAALLELLEPALFPNGKVYGFWQPHSPESHPAGPIISRNHFATWMILGISLTAGYLVAHARSHWRAGGTSLAARILGDFRSLWLLAACALMLAGLIMSNSRAGSVGVTVALLFGGACSWRRLHPGGRAGLVAFVLILAAAAAFLSKPEQVAARLSLTDQWGGRPMIWQQTMRMTEPYLLTGIGLGSFEVAMSVYQPMPRPALINHAHDQYLQVLAEGGLLMAVPAGLAVLAFILLARRRLRDDDSPLASLRQGALAGLVGFATQSVWETPLLTPAVFMLCAVVAGIAVHARDEDRINR